MDAKLINRFAKFTDLMYRQLEKNDHKSGWNEVPKSALIELVKQTVDTWDKAPAPEKIADVANWLMFLTED